MYIMLRDWNLSPKFMDNCVVFPYAVNKAWSEHGLYVSWIV